MDTFKKLKRRLTLSDKDPNFDEVENEDDVDDDAHRDMHRDYERAEAEGDKYPQGRPGSMLNRLISHGNKKTEDEIARDSYTDQSTATAAPGATGASATTTTTAGQEPRSAA